MFQPKDAQVDVKRGLVLTDRHSAPQSLGAAEAGASCWCWSDFPIIFFIFTWLLQTGHGVANLFDSVSFNSNLFVVSTGCLR